MNTKEDLGSRDIAKELRRTARLFDKYDDGEQMGHMACDGLVRKLISELTHWLENMDWIDD